MNKLVICFGIIISILISIALVSAIEWSNPIYFLKLSGGTLTGNLNLSGNNLTASWLFGKLNWSWIQNIPPYVKDWDYKLNESDQRYNDTALILSVNDTAKDKFNATYDATSKDVSANRSAWFDTHNSTYDATTADVNANRSDWFSKYNTTYDATTNQWNGNHSAYSQYWYNQTTPAINYANQNFYNKSSNLEVGIYNVTASWFFGLFNWVSGDSWHIFNGSTLTFNDTKLNDTISLTGVAYGFNSTYNSTYAGYASNGVVIAGENVTSGTVAFARLSTDVAKIQACGANTWLSSVTNGGAGTCSTPPGVNDAHTHDALNITTLTGFTNKILSNVANVTDAAKIGTCSAGQYASATTTSGVTCSEVPIVNSSYYLASNPSNYWNDTFATFNKTYADTLYAVIGYGDNWNKTYADTLYSGIEWDYNQTTPAIDYADDTFITKANEGNLNVNSSDYWDNLNDPTEITSLGTIGSATSITSDTILIGDGFGAGGITLEEDGDIWMNGSLYITENITTVSVNHLSVNGSIIPSLGNTFDIGSSTQKWQNGWFNNNLSVDGTTFHVDAANDKVGIGTTSPSEKLQVAGGIKTTGALIANTASSTGIEYSSGANWYSWGADGSTNGIFKLISVRSDGTNTLNVLSSDTTGNVGIGTTAPGSSLSVYGPRKNVGVGSYMNVMDIGSTDSMGAGVGPGLLFEGKYKADGTYTGFGQISAVKETATEASYNSAMIFSVGTDGSYVNEKMRITSGGNVGIGTTSPGAKLQINSPDDSIYPALSIRQDNAPTYGYDFNLDTLTDGKLYLDHIWAGTRYNSMTFDQAGNVGIGTTSPGAKLEVYRADAGEIGIRIHNYLSANHYWDIQQNSSDNDLKFGWAGTDLVTFTDAGDVGIGTVSPGEKLEVAGNVLVSDGGILVSGDGKIERDSNWRTSITETSIYAAGDEWKEGSRIDSETGLTLVVNTAAGVTNPFRILSGATDSVNDYGNETLRVNHNKVVQLITNTTAVTCDSSYAGGIYWNNATKKHYGCDGTNWNAFY